MERQAYFRLFTLLLNISPSGLIYFSQNLIKFKVFCGDYTFEHVEQILHPSNCIDKYRGRHFLSPAVLKGECWIL